AVGGFLIVRTSPFGLFKLALYVQPFLLGTLALSWSRQRRRLLWLLPLLLLAAWNLRTYQHDTTISMRNGGSLGTASTAQSHLLCQIERLVEQHPADRYVMDTNEVYLAKAAGCFMRGHSLVTPTHCFANVWVRASQEQCQLFRTREETRLALRVSDEYA